MGVSLCPLLSLLVPESLGDKFRLVAFHVGKPYSHPSLCLCFLAPELPVVYLLESLECICSASWWPDVASLLDGISLMMVLHRVWALSGGA